MRAILFITSTRIGDAMLSTGLLARLKQKWPKARIVVACGPDPAPLFQAMPMIERVITLPKQTYGRHWVNLWCECVFTLWHMVIDLRGSLISWFLPAISRRIFFPGTWRMEGAHVVEELSRFMDNTHNTRDWLNPSITVAASFHDFAQTHIPEKVPVIALGMAANWPGKQWPGDYFAELVDRLTGQNGNFPGAHIALFGERDSYNETLCVIEALPPERCINLLGKTTLPEAYACLTRCQFYIGNDSALMHMAAAAGLPTLGLFGPTDERRYAPWSQNAMIVKTRQNLTTTLSHPDHYSAKTMSLMRALNVRQVEKAVCDLWDRKGASSSRK